MTSQNITVFFLNYSFEVFASCYVNQKSKMSNMESTPPFRMPKRELPAKLKVKEPDGYLSVLAGGKSPIPMPSIPAWMLNTPMYSKLPMIPAPKGKITLYTTGLGEKVSRYLQLE